MTWLGFSTNLPKEVMGYPDYSYPDDIDESFITAQQVLNFLRSYAKHFKLEPHIKLQHEVIRVRPRLDDWEVGSDVTSHISEPVLFVSQPLRLCAASRLAQCFWLM